MSGCNSFFSHAWIMSFLLVEFEEDCCSLNRILMGEETCIEIEQYIFSYMWMSDLHTQVFIYWVKALKIKIQDTKCIEKRMKIYSKCREKIK